MANKRMKKLLKKIAKPLAVAVGLGTVAIVAAKVQKSIDKAKAAKKTMKDVMAQVKVEQKVSLIPQAPPAETNEAGEVVSVSSSTKTNYLPYIIIAGIVIVFVAMNKKRSK